MWTGRVVISRLAYWIDCKPFLKPSSREFILIILFSITVEALLICQTEIIDTIQSVQFKFRIDLASRNIPEYLIYLNTLEIVWVKFEQNNNWLARVKNESQYYYKENIF